MPTVMIVNGVKFYFYANDHEPIHVHVTKAGAHAKVEIYPEVRLVVQKGFSPNALRSILAICEEAREDIIDFWEEFFS